MVVETLKCTSQCSKYMHALVMSMNFLRYISSLIILLKYFYESLSGLEVEVLLHFSIVLLSFFLEKGTHVVTSLSSNSSKSCRLIWQF